MPLDGFLEAFNYSGGLCFRGRFGIAPTGWDHALYLVRQCPADQGADVAVFKRPLGPEGDPDHLFAVDRHRGARVANLGEMNDPEPYLRVHLEVSTPAHLGSQHFSKPVVGVLPRRGLFHFPCPSTTQRLISPKRPIAASLDDPVPARSPYCSPFSRRIPSTSGCHPYTNVTMNLFMRRSPGASSFSVDM